MVFCHEREDMLKVQSRIGHEAVDNRRTLLNGVKRLADRTGMQISVGRFVLLILTTPGHIP
jgi:hypothetical protein